jgi:phosphoribosylamine-glycine ligase
VKVDGKTVGYYSDACQRFGRPSGGALTRGTKNLTEVMYRVAGGEDVKLEYVAPYAAEIVTWSNSANDTAIPIKLKEKDMDRVLLGQFYKNKKDGMFYRIPMGDGGLIAECVGFGKTLEEAQQQATESLALVDFEGKEYEKDGWEQMDEKLDKARKLGVWPK